MLVLVAAAPLAVIAPAAHAQEMEEDEAAAAAEEEEEAAPARRRAIEEIVVTATKREESVQDIPIAVSAFPGEDLQARGVEDLEDLMQISPSLSVYSSNSTSNGGTLRIRGVGTTGNNPGLEAAVGSFIDGVYRSRAGIAYNELLDIERVEVLRGPQGTLFGKNTSAGAVHIITKKPEFEWGGWVSSSYGNHDYRQFASSVTGPIIDDKLAFRLAGSVSDRDGFYEKIGSNRAFGDKDRWAVRGQLLWTPTDDLETRFIFDYAEKEESCCPAAYAETRDPFSDGSLTGGMGGGVRGSGGRLDDDDADERTVGTNFDPLEEVEDWGVSVETNWDLGFGVLTGILAYREFDVDRGQDIDFSNADILQRPDTSETFENFSLEGRMAGTFESLDWLVGAYVFTEDIDTQSEVRLSTEGGDYLINTWMRTLDALGVVGTPLASPADLPPGFGFGEEYEQETEGFALFTQNVLHITEDLSATAGVRYNFESKEVEGIINDAAPGTVVNFVPPGFAGSPCDTLDMVTRTFLEIATVCNNASFEDERAEDKVTWTLALAYQALANVNVYTSWSRGYKAGGFNLDQQSLPLSSGPGMSLLGREPGLEFQRELADAYELGVKSTWLDGELTVNLAGFHTEFRDFQLNTFTGTGFVINNVGEVETEGVELETSWIPLDGVLTTFGFTYADTRYGDKLDPLVAGLEGRRITHAPVYQGSASIFAERTLPFGEWVGFVNLSTFYRGRHNTGSDLDEEKLQSGYWTVNSQVGVRSPGGAWEFLLWGTNITDKEVKTLVFDSVLQSVGSAPQITNFSTFVNEPRFYGATLKRYF